jgi:hypothetical protein
MVNNSLYSFNSHVFFCLFIVLRWEVVVPFVFTGGIVDHHYLFCVRWFEVRGTYTFMLILVDLLTITVFFLCMSQARTLISNAKGHGLLLHLLFWGQRCLFLVFIGGKLRMVYHYCFLFTIRHDITERLLKLALNTITLTPIHAPDK